MYYFEQFTVVRVLGVTNVMVGMAVALTVL